MEMSKVLSAAMAFMLAFGFSAYASGDAWAKDAPKLELKMQMEKEVKTLRGGKEVMERVPADKVKPGDVSVYTISYTNKGSGEARNASFVDPIPKGMVYVLGSAEGKESVVTCSIDGGKSFHAQPVKQTTKKPDGSTEEKDAPAASYTHIRWVVKKVMPHESGRVSFKASVE